MPGPPPLICGEPAGGRADLSHTPEMRGRSSWGSLEITIVAAAGAYAIVHERQDFEPARGRGWASVPAGRVLGRLPLDHGRALFRTFRVDAP